jgi:eukaryotic-like serine/threonine-protein kinase
MPTAPRAGPIRVDSPGAEGLDRTVATDGAALRGSALEGIEGPVFDGRFRIEERIAEGGFAVVYKAWQLALERRVALKVLKPPRNRDPVSRAEFRERFAAEAKTIARLRHPDIVDVYDFSVSTLPSGDLAPWMALEWLEGETLATQLARRRRSGLGGRDPREAVEFLRPVLRGLAHAHALGIVHRDVKPSNIMVVETEHGPSLRVLDFGIAKIMVDARTPNTGNTRTETAPAFSPAYAAPEQVAFSRTGPWTDVHALGLVLSELMTDRAPFSDPDPEAHLFEQVMSPARPTPASQGHDAGAFEPIIAKALALSPRDRWKNAGELMAALEEGAVSTAAGVVVAAPAPAPPSRRRFARPATWALGVTVVGAAIAGVFWNASEKREPPAPRASADLTVAAPPAPIAAPQASVAAPSVEPPPVQAERTLPRSTAKRRPRGPALAPLTTGDGRDLFNDTK